MCTVTFVNTNDKIIITSNRDEKVLRMQAIEPKSYLINNKNITFPKDPKAGGTWFAISEEGTVAVLLNGAKEKHKIKEKYRKSRGLILLDIISSDNPLFAWEAIELIEIEPFTIVLYYDQKLFQLQWDEQEKKCVELSKNDYHIWSSSTLYPAEIRIQRALWFDHFINENEVLNEEVLLDFHRHTNTDNSEFGLIINRNDSLKTLSITQTVLEKNRVSLSYLDLQKEEVFSNCYTTF